MGKKNAHKGANPPSGFRKYAGLLFRSQTGTIGFFILLMILIIAIFAPHIAPYDPTSVDLRGMRMPPFWMEGGSMEHILGCDNLGRDLWSRIIYGTRVSLLVGILSVLLAGAFGIVLGMVSGFYSGWIDSVIMRVTDAFFAIPRILMAMVVLMVAGSSVGVLILIIGGTSWVPFARMIRSEVLALKEKEFVKCSRSIGTKGTVILLRHILPNVMSSFIVLCTMNIAGNIISEAALSFLGVGIQPPTVSWGVMLAEGRKFLGTHWWIGTFPGIAITISVLGIMFLGNWLRDVLDPRNQGIK
jgi:peptide/nickel transport system permease protein